jgi:predicted DNA-binding transcriptional regulator YafY
VVNPIATVFSNDNYYLFCYDDKHGNVAQYRVDRMSDVSVLLSDITPNEGVEKFDISAYKKQLFAMFGGEEVEVEFEISADSDIIDIIHDKFGFDVKLKAKENGKASFSSKVRVSPTFIAWCISLGDRLKVVSPQQTLQEIRDYVSSLNTLYNE